MSEWKQHKINHPIKRLILLCIGLSVMAFGVAFSIKAALGTSPISSVPYVTSAISGLSVGTTTIIMNSFLVLIQIPILRKQYDWFQLFQFLAVILFGVMIDVAELVIQGISFSNYFEQWILCAIGIFLVAMGVSMEVSANLVTMAGEGVVLAICKVAPIKFSNMKVVFDVTLVCISILLSFLFLGHLDGVREGTVAAAIFVGLITKKTNKLMKKVNAVLLK
jgi:uncharacterized membrane protein YczE